MISFMSSNDRKAKITPETVAESVQLKEIWERTGNLPSQAVFGEVNGIGGQSAVNSFLNGKTPLSLKAARGFAKGLGCNIADFSPRLAALDTSWPFELVDRERYDALPPALRFKAQVRMMDEIEQLERAVLANGTHS